MLSCLMRLCHSPRAVTAEIRRANLVPVLGQSFHVHRLSRPLGSAIIPTWSHRQGFRISYPVHRLAYIHNIQCFFFELFSRPHTTPAEAAEALGSSGHFRSGGLIEMSSRSDGNQNNYASLSYGGQKLNGTILSQEKQVLASIFKMMSNRPRLEPTHKTIKGNSFHLWQHGMYIQQPD